MQPGVYAQPAPQMYQQQPGVYQQQPMMMQQQQPMMMQQQPMMVQQQPQQAQMMAPGPAVMGMMGNMMGAVASQAGKAMAARFAPIQVNMGEERKANYLDFNMFPTIQISTAAGPKTLYQQNPECQDAAWMMCGCGCQPTLKFREDDDLVVYKNSCTLCCPWETELNGKKIGHVEKPHCFENGFLYAVCPNCACNGTAKILEVHRGEDAAEIFTIRRELFPCWHCTDVCCGLLGMCMCVKCCIMMDGCCQYWQGKEYRQLSIPLYLPLEEGEDKVGNVTIIHRAEPCTCCCACMPAVRVTMEVPPTATEEDVLNLGLLAMFQMEPNWPCKCGEMATVRKPTGIKMFDCGMMSTVEWTGFDDIMDDGAAGAIARDNSDGK